MKLTVRIILVMFTFGSALLANNLMAQTLGVSIPAAKQGWMAGLNYHAEQTKIRLEQQFPEMRIVLVAASDAAQQADDLQDLGSIHEIDALVVLPIDTDLIASSVRIIKRRGVYVSAVSRNLIDPELTDTFVAGDNAQVGTLAAGYIKDELGGTGNIVVLRDLPAAQDKQRFDGFMAGLEGSGITILDTGQIEEQGDDGFSIMQKLLGQYPNIDAVWAENDDIASAAVRAVRQANRESELFVVGSGGMKDIVKAVMDGDRLTPADVLYPSAMISTAMELTALKLIANLPIAGNYTLASKLITRSNAEQYYYPESPF